MICTFPPFPVLLRFFPSDSGLARIPARSFGITIGSEDVVIIIIISVGVQDADFPPFFCIVGRESDLDNEVAGDVEVREGGMGPVIGSKGID